MISALGAAALGLGSGNHARPLGGRMVRSVGLEGLISSACSSSSPSSSDSLLRALGFSSLLEPPLRRHGSECREEVTHTHTHTTIHAGCRTQRNPRHGIIGDRQQ